MKDRQFLRLMGIVVATGLMFGLIAFRVTNGGASATTSSGHVGPTATLASGAVVAPSIAPDASAPAGAATDKAMPASIEPPTPAADPPPLSGPVNADPPGTAITNEPVGSPAADQSVVIVAQ